MVIVPGGDRVNDFVAGIDDGGVRGENDRARAAGDENGVERILQAEDVFVVADDGLPQLLRSIRRRIVRLTVRKRFADQSFEHLRDAELFR